MRSKRSGVSHDALRCDRVGSLASMIRHAQSEAEAAAACAGRFRRRVASHVAQNTCRPVRRTNGSPQRRQSGVAIVSLPIQDTSPPVFSRSLASALVSICRTRSRVMPISAPISSRVMPHGCEFTAAFAAACSSHSRSAHGSGMCAGARPRRLATTCRVVIAGSGGGTNLTRSRTVGRSSGSRGLGTICV